MTNTNTKYKFIDLFAGLGGFHLALQDLGCKCVFASELRTDLRSLYEHNFNIKCNGDITQIKPNEIPKFDILCAGFPCQPFSQAGKRQGFEDEKDRGNLFNYIADIIQEHRPKYVILENVSNLKGHDNGNTWNVIYNRLSNPIEDGGLNYEVKSEILSPHQFGIPQHRKRIYIICKNRDYGNLDYFEFPKATRKFECNIKKIINPLDTDIIKLKPDTINQLNVWQEFIDNTINAGDDIPTFPVWAMEFGANYDFEDIAPAFQKPEELIGKKGKLGKKITAGSLSECLAQLPIYARTNKNKKFPAWKIRYIQQNREFYLKHKKWLDKWLKKIEKLDNSHQKFEWNCGKNAEPIIEDKIVQFRASGIRVKLPTFSPALNLVGTQIPIFPWIEIPKTILKKGEHPKGRYMTVLEAAAIQGITDPRRFDLDYKKEGYPLSQNRIFEALGNAVNVTLVKHIAKNLIK